jgi:hypothetical protein
LAPSLLVKLRISERCSSIAGERRHHMTSLARSIDRTLCVRRHKSDRPALHTCHSSELPKRGSGRGGMGRGGAAPF